MIAGVAMRQISQFSHLIRRCIPKRKSHGRHDESRLTLLVNVRRRPLFKAFRLFCSIERHANERRLLLVSRNLVEVLLPRRIFRHRPPLFEHNPLELVNAQLLHDEFQPGLVSIFLFTESSENAPNCPRHRQQLLLRQKFRKQLGLMWNSA